MVAPPGELLETFSRAPTAHAAVVHGPVALGVVVAVVGFASAAAMAKNRTLRWATLLAALALAGTAWAATWTGERAFEAMGDPPPAARAIAEEHEEMGERAFLASLAILGLAGLAWAPRTSLAAGSAWAVFAGAGGLAYWIVSTAHLGGTLVYDFGVGTPKPVTERDLSPDAGALEWDPRAEFFRAEVRPALARYCFSCHGSVPNPAGGLRMTTAAGLLKGGDTGPAIVPGDPGASLLYRAISGEHPELAMPPGPRKPSAADIDAIRRWIETGAVWAPPEDEAVGR